jgi:hypothetical protein
VEYSEQEILNREFSWRSVESKGGSDKPVALLRNPKRAPLKALNKFAMVHPRFFTLERTVFSLFKRIVWQQWTVLGHTMNIL